MYKYRKHKHLPVLLDESTDALKVQKGKKYIDATVGDGGHALQILKNGGQLLAIDRDPEAIQRAREQLSKVYPACPDYTLVLGNFKDLLKVAKEHGFESSSGILFDLGVSSYQLEDPRKGLSFKLNAPLDMRLDPNLKITAADLVNQSKEGKLYEIFIRNAQEELARPIAKAIVSARSLKPIKTTAELAEIVGSVVANKRRKSKIHPATKVFLALRIKINLEIENLKEGLTQAIEILEPKGRLAVISFHETEDRLVKRALLKAQKTKKLKIITKKPIIPSKDEVKSNPRARSAKLRIGERL